MYVFNLCLSFRMLINSTWVIFYICDLDVFVSSMLFSIFFFLRSLITVLSDNRQPIFVGKLFIISTVGFCSIGGGALDVSVKVMELLEYYFILKKIFAALKVSRNASDYSNCCRKSLKMVSIIASVIEIDNLLYFIKKYNHPLLHPTRTYLSSVPEQEEYFLPSKFDLNAGISP